MYVRLTGRASRLSTTKLKTPSEKVSYGDQKLQETDIESSSRKQISSSSLRTEGSFFAIIIFFIYFLLVKIEAIHCFIFYHNNSNLQLTLIIRV